MAAKNELPHDLLTEKALVGCLILDGRCFDEILELTLTKKDFHHPKYGEVFECVKDLVMEQSPVDYVTICNRLSEKGRLEMLGGRSFITELSEDQASTANVYHYAKVVKDKSALRELITTAANLADKGRNFTGSINDYIQEVEKNFFKLTNDAKVNGMQALNICLKTNLKELQDTSRKPGEIAGLSTGYPKLDALLLGLQPGQLVILAARPAMGKTSLAMNMVVNACENTGLPVAVFSLEMLASELSMRLLTGRAKVDSRRVRTKDFNDTDLRALAGAVQSLSSLPIMINDTSVSILDIKSYCRKIKSEQGLGLVVIDYLQLMNSHTGNPSREQQISEISRGLKELAKELECPVLCLSQLNRGVEARPNKRPGVSDLRESGAIEQDADIVMMIYRDEVYNEDSKEPGVAEIIVGKNRAGETGTAKLAWKGSYTSFENLSYTPPPSFN